MRKLLQARAPRQESRDSTPLWAIGLIIFSTLLLTAGQLLLKQATTQGSLLGAFATPHFMFGAICLVVAGLTITFALKHGDLSVLYPFIALGFIWVALIGIFVLREQPDATQILGTLLIIGGVSLIGHHGRRA